jgi:hypothetical protein
MIETEVKRYLPFRDNISPRNPLLTFRKAVKAVIFATKLRKSSPFMPGENSIRK